jgi:hypothetical protein
MFINLNTMSLLNASISNKKFFHLHDYQEAIDHITALQHQLLPNEQDVNLYIAESLFNIDDNTPDTLDLATQCGLDFERMLRAYNRYLKLDADNHYHGIIVHYLIHKRGFTIEDALDRCKSVRFYSLVRKSSSYAKERITQENLVDQSLESQKFWDSIDWSQLATRYIPRHYDEYQDLLIYRYI